ncbi:MAG: hypothetical protein ACRDMV_12510 [Streptosporangiales bacterium]
MADDVRAILQSRYPNISDDSYPLLKQYWDELTALSDTLDPAASGPAEIAVTYRATGPADD